MYRKDAELSSVWQSLLKAPSWSMPLKVLNASTLAARSSGLVRG